MKQFSSLLALVLCASAFNLVSAQDVADKKIQGYVDTVVDTHTFKLLSETFRSDKPNQAVFVTSNLDVLLALYAGSGDDSTTRKQISAALALGEIKDPVAAHAALRKTLVGKRLEWKSRGAMFLKNGYPVLDRFKKSVEPLGIHSQNLSFADSSQTAGTINKWLNDGKERPTVLSPRDITFRTLWVIASSSQVAGSWSTPFEKDKSSWLKIKGKQVDLTLMTRTGKKDIATCMFDGDRRTLVLPLEGGGVFYAVPVDHAADSQRVIAVLAKEGFAALSPPTFVAEEWTIGLPSMNYTQTLDLKQIYSSRTFGMVDMFGGKADFSRISGGKDVFVSTFRAVNAFELGKKGFRGSSKVVAVGGAKGIGPIVKNELTIKQCVWFVAAPETGCVICAGRFLDPRDSVSK